MNVLMAAIGHHKSLNIRLLLWKQETRLGCETKIGVDIEGFMNS
jgi:hypothetical protein